jgi:hypothetical protein
MTGSLGLTLLVALGAALLLGALAHRLRLAPMVGYIAGTIETVLCLGLFFGVFLKYVAFIAFIHLLVAGTATYKVTKSWIWVIGGIEYCVFWAICCLVVAMHAYHAGI